MIVSGLDGSLSLNSVGWNNDRHTRNGTHNSNILIALVSSAVLSYRETSVGSANLNVEVRVTHRVSDLLKRTTRREHCKRSCKDLVTRSCDASCHTNHVGLSNAAIHKAIRILLAVFTRASCLCQVSVKDEKIIVLFTKLYQGFSVSLSGGNFLYICHVMPPLPQALSSPARIAPD